MKRYLLIAFFSLSVYSPRVFAVSPADSYHQQGVEYSQKRDYVQASDYFRLAAESDPTLVHLNDWGFSLLELKKYGDAESVLLRAQRLDPSNRTVCNNLGSLYYRMERYRDALPYFQKAFRQNPRDAKLAYNLGVTYCRLGRYMRGWGYLKQAKKLDRLYCLERPGTSQAQEYLNDQLTRRPNDPFLLHAAETIAKPQPDVTAEDLVQLIQKKYGMIRSMRGRMTRTTEAQGGGAQKSVADFFLVAPSKVRLDNIEPVPGHVILNETEYWVVNTNNPAEADHRLLAEMDPVARAAFSDEGLLKCNPIRFLLTGYQFERIGDYDGCYILKFTPKEKRPGAQVSFILLKVKPAEWLVLAQEVFGMDQQMFLQTKYHEYKTFPDGSFFPARIETRMMVERAKVIEETQYSRLDNSPITNESIFRYTVRKGGE
ncbi:MAG TPA: tetratricopeptide repeat protein [Elusimicrobiota bacterium]|nr:tetratricopeptide repeat protein [Elusimicrobiota bacterium]